MAVEESLGTVNRLTRFEGSIKDPNDERQESNERIPEYREVHLHDPEDKADEAGLGDYCREGSSAVGRRAVSRREGLARPKDSGADPRGSRKTVAEVKSVKVGREAGREKDFHGSRERITSCASHGPWYPVGGFRGGKNLGRMRGWWFAEEQRIEGGVGFGQDDG
ncbi:hypothetical protein KM043_012640 [Ampulex compressa]|nr:hypothetical protein KM043_012640 [Ampulex compressa]